MRFDLRNEITGGILACVALIVGCDDAGRGGVGSTVAYDSAGIEVLVTRGGGPEAAVEWSVGTSPLWTAGDRDAEVGHQLHDVVGAVRFGDGRVVVANAGSNELRFFDETGEFLLSSGGAGSGPGEFSGLRGLRRISGDSLVTVDLGLRRISVFDDRGGFVRSFGIPSVDDGAILDLVGASADGWFLYRTLPVMGAAQIESGIARLPMTVYRTDREGRDVRRLGEFPGFEILVTPMEGRPPMSGLLTFGRSAVMAPSRAGFLLGVGDDYEIGLYDAEGILLRLFRREFEPRPVRDEHIEVRRREIRDGMPDSPTRDVFERRLEAAPEIFPPYDTIMMDLEGVVWVGRYTAPRDETRRWDLFDVDQGMVGSLEVPSSVSILEASRDFVLGVHTDDLGVEVVQVYALTRGD